MLRSLPKSSAGSAHNRSHMGPKSVDLANVVDGVDFRRESTVDAQILLVQHGSQRQAIERLHERVVKSDRVLDLAFRLLILEGSSTVGERLLITK